MKIRLGTRGSKLALAQAAQVNVALARAHPALTVETVIIKTEGDWKPQDGETRLSEAQGGKGMFAREIERALMDGDIDIGVHSLKDMPSFLPDGLRIDHVLEREDPRDAFVSFKYASMGLLPKGAVVGTSSLRRQSILLSSRPDIMVVPLRGNVDTRLQKIKDGMADATFLAMAGLNRLGLSGDMIHPIETHDMLPACGQGIIGIETREDDAVTRGLMDSIHHKQTGLAASAERAVLKILDGSCHTPIGAFAVISGGRMQLRAMVASPDGMKIYEDRVDADVGTDERAMAVGGDLGRALKSMLPRGFLA